MLSLVGIGCRSIVNKEDKQDKQDKQETAVVDQKWVDPAAWKDKFPNQYATYQKNKEGGVDHSKYRGSEPYDRISAWPFQWILYEGWGMGDGYTESRGHPYALIDQLEITSSRRGAGGVCLSCKTSFEPQLKKEMGVDYFRLPYDEVYAKIPEKFNETGIVCIDCHEPETAELRISRSTLTDALKEMDNVPAEFDKSQMGSLTCAQCHVTYSIPKDKDKKSIGLLFPWKNAEWGAITIEDIEKQIKDEGLYEFTNSVTDIRLGHLRHPCFELYTNKSLHYNMGVSCAGCHMPKEEANGKEFTSHHNTSPFKQGLTACKQCHTQTPEELKELVIEIQDEVNEIFTEAGFTAAQAARAIEMANNIKSIEGINKDLLNEAKVAYEKAYYRIVFVGADNSMGFHNPTEAKRVLKDGLVFAQEAEKKAREAIKGAGETPPEKFELDLEEYPYDPEQNRAAGKREQ